MTTSFFNKYTDSNSGLIYYQIPENTILYRGDSNPKFNPNQLLNIPLFFGLNNEDVEQYGVVYRYKTMVPLQLLALDGHNPSFFDNVPANIKTILNEQYGFNDNERRRNSDNTKDKLLVTYICENGFSGYANDRMNHNDPGRGDFHKEIVICDINNIEYDGKEKISIDKEELKHYDHLLQKIGNPVKKNKIYDDKNLQDMRSFSFGSSLFDSPPSSPGREKFAFGGKTKSKKTKKNKRKTIRKRKSKKGEKKSKKPKKYAKLDI